METPKIKQSHQAIHAYLHQNKDKKIKDVLDSLDNLCASGRGGGGGNSQPVCIRDVEGITIAIRTPINGHWLPLVGPEAVEVTPKKSSTTDYSSYSKEGTKYYNARLKITNEVKAKNAETTQKRVDGMMELEEYKAALIPVESYDGVNPPGYDGPALSEGFATKDECEAYLKKNGAKFG